MPKIHDFTVRKQVLARVANIDVTALNRLERFYIIQHHSNDPAIGYNRNGVKRQLCKTIELEEPV